MKANKEINLTLGCLIALALKKQYPTCTVIKIELREHGGVMVYFSSSEVVSSKSFEQIEEGVREIVRDALPISGQKCSLKEIGEMFTHFKPEIVSKIFNDSFSWQKVKIGNENFIAQDGLVFNSSSNLNFFLIENVGGATLTADERILANVMSAVAFVSESEKNKYLNFLEESKQHDHRRLGQQLEIFTFNDLAGKGMPIWLPNGGIIRKTISSCIDKLRCKYDFKFVSSPVLGTLDLFKKSRHWEHYKDYMFPPVTTVDNEQFVLRPMTCPHHCLIYKATKHTDKDLPLRLTEDSILHRYEASGGLMGLERVRTMTLPDTHIFCESNQIMSEIKHCYQMVSEMIKLFGFSFSRIDLSLHDPNDKEKYVDNSELWSTCEEQLRKALRELKVDYVEKIGEAAFYGPKIDFQVQTYLGKIITISTIQLDFNLPDFFDLKYAKNGKDYVPVIIHFGLLGTLERFVAILLEQTKGVFPFWLAINQVRIIPIADKHIKYSQKLLKILQKNQIRADIDFSNERLARKIRNAQMSKIPYQIIIGDAEATSVDQEISYREYGDNDLKKIKFNDFVSMLIKKNESCNN